MIKILIPNQIITIAMSKTPKSALKIVHFSILVLFKIIPNYNSYGPIYDLIVLGYC